MYQHCNSTWSKTGNEQALKIDTTKKKFKKSIINELKLKNLLPFCPNFLCYLCHNEYTKRNHKSIQTTDLYLIDSNKNEKQNCTPSKTVQDKVEQALEELIFFVGRKIL